MLHPFTATPVCHKCGHTDISWRYHGPVPKGDYFRYDTYEDCNRHEKREHIYLHCQRCKREWMMRCKPKVAPQPKQPGAQPTGAGPQG